MIRKMNSGDREIFLTLVDEFYHSTAVMHPIPSAYYAKTFDEIVGGSPYADCWLVFIDDEAAGYAQLSFTWSSEAGGVVAWFEELYIRPQFQNRGLGKEMFSFLDEHYAGKLARIRLEVEPDNDGARRLYDRLGYVPLPYFQMYRELSAEDC